MRHPFLRTLAGSGVTTDPNFENVTLLLHGDGTNGGQNNTFVDGSTNNFTITRNGNTTQGTFSPYGDNWSNYFDGTDDYLSIADNANLRAGSGTFTIEAWIYRNATGAAHTIYAKGGASTGIVLQVTSTNVLRFTHTTTNIDSTGTIALATWTHVAVVREGTGTNETKLYINGTQDGAGTVSTDFTQTEEVRIGTDRSAAADFNGYISNLRFVKGTAVYTGAFTVPTSPLTAISNTQLLTCKSNRFRDESANAFTVTRNNNASVQRFSPFSPTAAYSAGTIGGSVYLDGTGDYLTVASNAAFSFGTGDYTVEAWAYFTGTSNDQNIVEMRGLSGTGNQIRIAKSGTNINLGYGTVDAQLSGTWPGVGNWIHIAAVRSGTTSSFYINGSRVGTKTDSTNLSQGAPVIGAYSATAALVTGYISDVRLVKGTAIYDPSLTTLTLPTSTLTAATNTQLLCNFTNAAIRDNAMMTTLETVGNVQISTSVKKYGTGSMSFDGAGDYLDCRESAAFGFGTGDFTIEFWIYINSQGSFQIYDSRVTGSEIVPTIYIASGQIRYYVSSDRITGATLSSSTWYHIALSRSGTSTKLFVDGTQSGSTYTDSNNYATLAPYIGIYKPTGGAPLNGYIDDLRITKGVARYTANFTAPTAAFPDL